MRQVATIPDESTAKRLTDHLLTMDITTRLDKSPEGWIVWVHREDRMDQARREVEAFLAEPNHPRFQGASKTALALRKDAAKKQAEHVKKSISLSGRLNVPSFRRCPVTYALIAASVAITLLTGFGQNPQYTQAFMFSPEEMTVRNENLRDLLGETAPQFSADMRIPVPRWQSLGLGPIRKGQVWRLISPIFVHMHSIHLAFNMIMLYRIGGLIELRKGRLVMALLVLATGILSDCGQYYWVIHAEGPESLRQFGGMSGVVYGLFGYVWMKSDYDPEADIKVPTDLIVQMIVWLFLCMTGLLGPIANAAHVAGLFAGLLIGVAPHLWHSWR